MSVEKFDPAVQFQDELTFYISQKYKTTDYWCCCYRIDGRYFEVKVPHADKSPSDTDDEYLFRAEENLVENTIDVRDKDGLVFIQLEQSVETCLCGGLSGPHTRVEVYCSPGTLIGNLHYAIPSDILIKDPTGIPVFRLRNYESPGGRPSGGLGLPLDYKMTKLAVYPVVGVDEDGPLSMLEPICVLEETEDLNSVKPSKNVNLKLKFRKDIDLDLSSKIAMVSATFHAVAAYNIKDAKKKSSTKLKQQ